MLSYIELSRLGYCPKQKYGFGKPFPPGFRLPQSVEHSIWKQMPLQIQVMYEYGLDGTVTHALTSQIEV